MKTSGSSFELILQEVLKQKQLLTDLQAENAELYRQLADLREGRGILVDILGKRVPLFVESVAVSSEVDPIAQADPSLQETRATNNNALLYSSPETPLPNADFGIGEVQDDQEEQLQVSASAIPTFLEEALIDEFSKAATTEIAVWSGPVTNHPVIDEKEKETLRRELSESFLLE